jgi:excinuclease UvrABC helicase subunit UvrB
MTEKDITKIAELTAKIIIDHLEEKQDEWNQDFQVSMENIKQDGFGNMRMMSEQEIIHMQIDELQQELDKAVEDENFTLASKINNKIINLNKKLK